ncbi:hypothetical protein C2S52_020557 [Perilla frutescens var. hirtella]|nr:hypothetical protein C2S52_020557 [Perilla frutescens var. hirtella]
MSSETSFPDQSSAGTERNSSSRGIPFILPFIFGISTPQETQDEPSESRERVIFINALTQTMVVVESSGESPGLNSLFDDFLHQKRGRRPASRASIDAMPSVEVVSGENSDEQCAVCLEGWEAGESAKEMPCKHRFHGDCIERWLNISGCCPVCRYQMPEEEKNRDERERGRGIFWLSFGFGGGPTISWDENRDTYQSSQNHRQTED